LKVLFPFVGDSVGGSHLSSLELCSLLRSKGYEPVIVLHRPDGPLARLLQNKKIAYQTIETKRLAGETGGILGVLAGALCNLRPFFQFIRRNGIDIVHGNDLRVNLTWSVATRFSGRRFIWHQRTIMSSSLLWLCVSLLCTHFVGISKAVMRSAPLTIPEKRKSLVYNSVNVDGIHKAQKLSEFLAKDLKAFDGKLLGYVGRLVDYKNVDFVISGVADLIEIHKRRVKLLIVGTGTDKYVKYLRGIVRNLKIEDSVFFLGYVENPLRIIDDLDVLIASSSIDAFGRTIVEAMLLETPVLVADKSGHLEIVENNYNGLIFGVDDRIDFTQKALQLLEDTELRQALVRRGLSSSRESFSDQRSFDAIDAIYRS